MLSEALPLFTELLAFAAALLTLGAFKKKLSILNNSKISTEP